MGDHIVYPRIIFISDGNLNLVDDMPGQLLNPDDQVLTNVSSQLSVTSLKSFQKRSRVKRNYFVTEQDSHSCPLSFT